MWSSLLFAATVLFTYFAISLVQLYVSCNLRVTTLNLNISQRTVAEIKYFAFYKSHITIGFLLRPQTFFHQFWPMWWNPYWITTGQTVQGPEMSRRVCKNLKEVFEC